MNLVLLFKADFVDGSKQVRIKGRRHKHILDVHRVSKGDTLCVGLLGGRIGTGLITALDNQSVEMDVTLDHPPPQPLPITLILAMPRPIVLKRILVSVSSWGIKKIFLLNYQRVEKSFWQSSIFKENKIKESLILGLEQAKDTVLPEVLLRPRFKPFVEDELPELMKGTLALVAHPDSAELCPGHVQQPVTLVMGPEGGLIPYEIEKLTACGFKSVHLGTRPLRVRNSGRLLYWGGCFSGEEALIWR